VLTREGTALGSAAAQTAADLVSLAGGLDALRSAQSAYREAYWSEAEQTAWATEQMAAALADLGLVLPEGRDGFRALVEAQDLATEAGRRLYTGLLALAPGFDSLQTALERQEADRQAAMAAAQSQAQAAWERQQAAMQAAREEWVQTMRGQDVAGGAVSVASARAAYSTQLAAARAGDADALGGISQYAERLIAASVAAATSRTDAERVRGLVLAELEALARGADGRARRGYAEGGIATGPASGYTATLHGTEAVIPLRGGAVPVQLSYAELLEALREVRDEVRRGNVSIAGNTGRVAGASRGCSKTGKMMACRRVRWCREGHGAVDDRLGPGRRDQRAGECGRGVERRDELHRRADGPGGWAAAV